MNIFKPEFKSFNKIHRISRECVITEKLDGTNAQIFIYYIQKPRDYEEQAHHHTVLDYWYGIDGSMWGISAGSRKRLLTETKDNYGFAKWVKKNINELKKLGEGRYFGEWMGHGIQRKYGLTEKRFYLFNTSRWGDDRDKEKYPEDKTPSCCHVVPVIKECIFDTTEIDNTLNQLKEHGSYAIPGYMNPEGIVIYHKQSNQLFKRTFNDGHKGK